jgi:hypothetical protein
MKILQISFNVIGFLFLGLASFTYLFVSLGEFNIRGGWEYRVCQFLERSGWPGQRSKCGGALVALR